jgi:hypothetical protein
VQLARRFRHYGVICIQPRIVAPTESVVCTPSFVDFELGRG